MPAPKSNNQLKGLASVDEENTNSVVDLSKVSSGQETQNMLDKILSEE